MLVGYIFKTYLLLCVLINKTKMKIAIVYQVENNSELEIIKQITVGAKSNPKNEVKVMSISSVDHPFLLEADALILGCSVKNGTFSHEIKKWLDIKYTKGQLRGKLASVFCLTNKHGFGAETTLLGLIGHLLIKGMVIYSGGTTEGEPHFNYGLVSVTGRKDSLEEALVYGQRIAQKTIDFLTPKTV